MEACCRPLIETLDQEIPSQQPASARRHGMVPVTSCWNATRTRMAQSRACSSMMLQRPLTATSVGPEPQATVSAVHEGLCGSG